MARRLTCTALIFLVMAAAATAVPFEMPRLDDGDDGGDGGFDIGPVTSVADDVVGSDGAAAAAPAAAAAGDSVVAAAVAAADTLNHIIAAAAAANKTAAAAAAAAAGAAGAGDNAKAATSTGPSPGFVSRSLWKVTSPAEWLPGQVEISYSNCSALANMPCDPNLLTTWWDKATHQQRALVLMTLNKDTYPRPVNLNVSRDGETYRCRFTAKYKALGADSVRFVNSELTHVALIKAGCNVFMNYRGNWNFAQEDNNSKEWPLHPGPLGGRVHGGWLRSIRQTWRQVEQVLRDDFACTPATCRMVLTGHSRGAPLAAIAFANLDGSRLVTRAALHTFGGCRPGNHEFQELFNQRLGNMTFNWWNREDWVPMQPWINAQAPRLHMTPDACPDPKRPSVDACYDTRAAGKVCAAGKKSYRAVRDHRERPYIAALLACAKPVGLSDACVAAIR